MNNVLETSIEASDDSDVELNLEELRLLKLIAQDFKLSVIADKLNQDLDAVIEQKKELQKKFNVRGTAGLTLYAIHLKLLDTDFKRTEVLYALA